MILYFLSNLGMGGGGTITPTGPSTLREVIYSRLSTTAELTAIVGDRITPFGRPQCQLGPAATFQIVGREFGHHLGGPDGTSSATLRISAWSRKYLEAEAVAKVVRDAFDGYRGTIGGVSIMGCFLEDEADLPEYPRNGSDSYLYQIVLTFNVVHRT